MMASIFHGYAIKLEHVITINLYLAKIHILQPRARHIMFVYNVQGYKDSCDDGENFGDLQVVKLLAKAGIDGVALFVTHFCGPHQLGSKWFQCICGIVNDLLQLLQGETEEPVDVGWMDEAGMEEELRPEVHQLRNFGTGHTGGSGVDATEEEMDT